MGEAVGFDEFVDGRENVLVARDVFEGCGAVFLNPEVKILAYELLEGMVEVGRTMGESPQPLPAGLRRSSCPLLMR